MKYKKINLTHVNEKILGLLKIFTIKKLSHQEYELSTIIILLSLMSSMTYNNIDIFLFLTRCLIFKLKFKLILKKLK